jgi:hypothetical protein
MIQDNYTLKSRKCMLKLRKSRLRFLKPGPAHIHIYDSSPQTMGMVQGSLMDEIEVKDSGGMRDRRQKEQKQKKEGSPRR